MICMWFAGINYSELAVEKDHDSIFVYIYIIIIISISVLLGLIPFLSSMSSRYLAFSTVCVFVVLLTKGIRISKYFKYMRGSPL
jgi:ABC-type siderophore export system fused ATPase/permease subunit